MKVTPSNQTLILAGESLPQGGNRPGGGVLTGGVATGGSVLKTVTIVSAQPDSSLMYLRADYAAPDGEADGGAVSIPARSSTANARVAIDATPDTGASAGRSLVSTEQHPFAGRRDTFGNVAAARGGAGLYARTQRILAEPSDDALIDVLA